MRFVTRKNREDVIVASVVVSDDGDVDLMLNGIIVAFIDRDTGLLARRRLFASEMDVLDGITFETDVGGDGKLSGLIMVSDGDEDCCQP